MKHVLLGGKRMNVPFFAATVGSNRRLWPWTRGVKPEALLISYDVLGGKRANAKEPLTTTLEYDGLVIVDSGGYGTSIETDPLAVYRLQRAIGASVGVVLDEFPSAAESSRRQWASVRQTLANAQLIHARHRGKMALEAVVQGATAAQRVRCGTDLVALGFQIYGVPVSAQARYRHYVPAIERFTESVGSAPANSHLHALGCGSRSLIAILSALGATLFDSRSYYQRAIYGENLDAVTMCAVGKPRGKPGCADCLKRNPKGQTLESRTDYNLKEIQKEIFRVRCALEESVMPAYLERRLGKQLFKRIGPWLDRPIRRHLPIARV
jgi:hypothetical protein